MKSFWHGFEKQALGSMTGGSGFFGGVGKGQLQSSADTPWRQGTADSPNKTDKTLLDHERNPRSFEIGDAGPEFQDEANPHVRY